MTDITGMKPAILIDRLCCGLGQLVVALHDIVTLHADLSVRFDRLFRAIRPADRYAAVADHPSGRGGIVLITVSHVSDADAGGCLCLTIGSMEYQVRDLTSDHHIAVRTERGPGYDAAPQAA